MNIKNICKLQEGFSRDLDNISLINNIKNKKGKLKKMIFFYSLPFFIAFLTLFNFQNVIGAKRRSNLFPKNRQLKTFLLKKQDLPNPLSNI
jgi:hypothetical protein